MESIREGAEKIGYLFYIASPNKTTYATTEEVPNYLNQSTPYFLVLVLLEVLILRLKNKKVRVNDLVNSTSHGIIYIVMGYLVGGVELVGYQWVYERRILDLDWNSPVTWWTAAILVDHGYYWVHRFVHEVSLGWAAHQVHHSSEEYNLSTATRQSLFQKFFGLGFYLPCAFFGVPLPALLVHLQFNLLYQFWIHTEVVSTIGPLEWVLNTPSHHRVHHGSDPWCLDKNYAGVLIIWDRIYGTFQAEKKDVKINYGLIRQPKKLNIVWQQIFYFKHIFEKAVKMTTWTDSYKALFFGPGWAPKPTTPVVKAPAGIKKPKPMRVKYDPQVSTLMECYLFSHFFISLIVQQSFLVNFSSSSCVSVLFHILYLLVTLGNIGSIYDGWSGATLLEAVRCTVVTTVVFYFPLFDIDVINKAMIGYNAVSAVVWTLQAAVAENGSVKKD